MINPETDDRSSSVTDIRIEVTDDELKDLSNYFLKSKDEIQKKVDSLLSLEIPIKISPIKLAKSENSMINAKIDNTFAGKPIDLQTAITLREITIGSCVHTFSNDWRRAKFMFRDENSELSYGLLSEKNGSKGLILGVQAVLLKNLIDKGYTDINGKSIQDSEWRNKRKILQPNNTERNEALVKTISDILWRAGEMVFACVALNSGSICFEFSSDTGSLKGKSNYFGDGITERLCLYEFSDYKLLEAFIRKNLNTFQKEDGCLTFLYSLVLSRKPERLRNDLQAHTLLGDMEDCKISLFTLILTGVARPYLHNGVTYYDSQGEALTTPLTGIKNRSDIGLLYWDNREEESKRTEVGSMLKTPRYPIWLLWMGKNLLAIMFHTNLDLINNWRFELSFSLNFYSPLKKQDQKHEISIENRNLDNEIQDQSNIKLKYGKLFKFIDDSEKEPEIVNIIKSKWPDCEITNTDGKDLMCLL